VLFQHCLWHVKGVAAKYFSVIHAPAKRIFWVNRKKKFILILSLKALTFQEKGQDEIILNYQGVVLPNY